MLRDREGGVIIEIVDRPSTDLIDAMDTAVRVSRRMIE